MARKANEIEKNETDAQMAALPTADALATFGHNQVAIGRAALFNGVVGLAVARIAHIKGWNADNTGQAAVFDKALKESLGEGSSRATVYRIAGLVEKTSKYLANKMKQTVADAKGASTVESAMKTVVADLGIAGANDLNTLAALVSNKSAAKPKTVEEKVLAVFTDPEEGSAKASEFSDDTLSAIAKWIAGELASRAESLGELPRAAA